MVFFSFSFLIFPSLLVSYLLFLSPSSLFFFFVCSSPSNFMIAFFFSNFLSLLYLFLPDLFFFFVTNISFFYNFFKETQKSFPVDEPQNIYFSFHTFSYYFFHSSSLSASYLPLHLFLSSPHAILSNIENVNRDTAIDIADLYFCKQI